MLQTDASGWIEKAKRSWRSWRSGPTGEIATEIDQKPAFSLLLHVRAFASLIRQVMFR
jgi:hypothetical protein